MNRCLQLAQLGAGYVAPNPMVGALLLYNDTIIGEGYHQQYGEAHAEVNCINSVAEEHKHLIPSSRLYVSLEPCAHYGKTPPCAHLIIQQKISEVVVACRDSFEKVNGHGIQLLKIAGVKVTEGVLEKEALGMNKRFFTFHEKKRPFIILKWAQTKDLFIANAGFKKQVISNEFTNRFTHRLRAEEAAIIVGTNTARYDDPSLTVRNWPGKNPLRIVIDKQLSLSPNLVVNKQGTSTIILNFLREEHRNNIHFFKLSEKENILDQLMNLLFENNINSLVVEGGAQLLQSFIDKALWDEAMVITNNTLNTGAGIAAPVLTMGKLFHQFNILSDKIELFKNLEQ